MIFGLVFALIVAVPSQNNSTESQVTMQESAQDAYERHHQTAIRVNDLAGRIHSQADADTMTSEIAELLAKAGVLQSTIVACHGRANSAPGNAEAGLVQAHQRRL